MVYIIDSNFNKCFVYLIVLNEGIVHLNDSKCMVYSNCDKSVDLHLTCIYRDLLGFKHTLLLLGLIIIQVHHAFTETDY